MLYSKNRITVEYSMSNGSKVYHQIFSSIYSSLSLSTYTLNAYNTAVKTNKNMKF